MKKHLLNTGDKECKTRDEVPVIGQNQENDTEQRTRDTHCLKKVTWEPADHPEELYHGIWIDEWKEIGPVVTGNASPPPVSPYPGLMSIQ